MIVARSISDLGHLASHEQGAFFHNALVELIVGFGGSAHVNVEFIDCRTGAFLDKMRKLQTLHAADGGAVIIEVLVARADTVDDAHCLRLCLAVTQGDLTASGT